MLVVGVFRVHGSSWRGHGAVCVGIEWWLGIVSVCLGVRLCCNWVWGPVLKAQGEGVDKRLDTSIRLDVLSELSRLIDLCGPREFDHLGFDVPHE